MNTNCWDGKTFILSCIDSVPQLCVINAFPPPPAFDIFFWSVKDHPTYQAVVLFIYVQFLGSCSRDSKMYILS